MRAALPAISYSQDGQRGKFLSSGQAVGLLYGVSTFDVMTFAGAVVALLVVTLAASLVPARRVASIDPATALRCD